MKAQNTTRLLDTDMTLERLAGDETLLNKAANAFIRIAPRLLASINAALNANDLNRAFKRAHWLKRAVTAFEAPLVVNSVLNVERHAINHDAQAAVAAFPKAQALVERLLTELTPMATNSELEAQA